MNLREKAINDLIEEAKRNINNHEMLYQALRRTGDMDLFALYVEVFGHPVSATKYPDVPCLQHGGSLTCHCGEPA